MTELNLEEIKAREAENGLRRPVRILYVLDGTQPSYGHKQLVRLLGQFTRMQLRAAVASIENYGDAVEKIQGKNVPVVSLELDPAKSEKLSERLGALMRLRTFIAHNNPEVLHLIGDNARSLGVLAASSFRSLPVVCSTRPHGRRSISSRFLDAMGSMIANRPVHLFLDTDELKLAEGRLGDQSPYEVIGHGIDFAAAQTAPLLDFEVLPPGTFDIGMPVSTVRCQAIREGLSAFKVFLGHCPQARLILFGDVKELDIEPWATDLGVADQVLSLPLPQEPGALLGRLNVLWAHDEVLPDQEMILQAMAIGLPVVVDHTTGLADGIREIGGAMMRDGAWPQQFAEATRDFMNDATLAQNVGNAGKALVKARFRFRTQAEKLRSIYARLVHGADV